MGTLTAGSGRSAHKPEWTASMLAPSLCPCFLQLAVILFLPQNTPCTETHNLRGNLRSVHSGAERGVGYLFLEQHIPIRSRRCLLGLIKLQVSWLYASMKSSCEFPASPYFFLLRRGFCCCLFFTTLHFKETGACWSGFLVNLKITFCVIGTTS